jgi:triphosphoribosyl-dephospho-CoA synthase
MMDSVQTNTSLGTILLLVPLGFAYLASSDWEQITSNKLDRLKESLKHVLSNLSQSDSSAIYEAIRIAKPGGMGKVREMDLSSAAPPSIRDAMALAAPRDDIALQYVTNFHLVFEYAELFKQVPSSTRGSDDDHGLRWLQVRMLADRVDSLIVRKNGLDFAEAIQRKAKSLHEMGEQHGTQSDYFQSAWKRLDAIMRDEQHAGNPGTTADLIAAVCFVSEAVA